MPAGHDQAHVNTVLGKRQAWIDVQVLHPVAIEPGIGPQFGFVEAVADHLPVTDLLRQMADPATHQIQYHGARRNPLSIEIGQLLAKGCIKMLHKTRLGIKQLVISAVQFLALVVT